MREVECSQQLNALSEKYQPECLGLDPGVKTEDGHLPERLEWKLASEVLVTLWPHRMTDAPEERFRVPGTFAFPLQSAWHSACPIHSENNPPIAKN